jgi:protein-S-isoprenylcysteine O-methyltransferase Ste14
MDKTAERGAAVRIAPPVLYLVGIVVGVVLDFYTEFLRLDITLMWRIIGGVATAALGVGVMISAIGGFKATEQDPKPWLPSPEIISTGIYGLTRNPMYVSMAVLQVAVSIALSNGWVAILVIPVLVAVYMTAVRPEEAYLAGKFGDIYLQYKHSVRRWI